MGRPFIISTLVPKPAGTSSEVVPKQCFNRRPLAFPSKQIASDVPKCHIPGNVTISGSTDPVRIHARTARNFFRCPGSRKYRRFPGYIMKPHVARRMFRNRSVLMSAQLPSSCRVLGLIWRQIKIKMRSSPPARLPIASHSAARPVRCEISQELHEAIPARVRPDVELYRTVCEMLYQPVRLES